MELAIVIATVASVLYFMKRYYEKHWADGLLVKISFAKMSVNAGEQIVVKEEVYNKNFLILPYIHLKYNIGRSILFQDTYYQQGSQDRSYRNDIFSLLFRQKVTRRIPAVCSKRGYYAVSCVDAVFTGLFMNDIWNARYDQNTQLLVYPKLVDVSGIEIIYQQMCGEQVAKRRIYEDICAFRGVRNYQTGDTLSKINWKATAKTGTLQVNAFEDTRRQSAFLLLDIYMEERECRELLQETAISIAASLVMRLTEKEIPIGLVSNGKDAVTGNNVVFKESGNRTYGRDICTGLARIDLEQGNSRDDETGWNWEKWIPPQSALVLISCGSSRGMKQKVLQYAEEGWNLLWIVPVLEGENVKVLESQMKSGRIQIFQWEVKKNEI